MNERDERDALINWASGYLDPLGIEAVRRFLAGAVAAHPVAGAELPPPRSALAIAQDARQGSTAWGALQLATVALRVSSGVAWWKPAARYVLADTATPRTKVSGTWGNASRSILESLYGLERGTADDAAHSGSTVDLVDVAQDWGVSPSEMGTAYGPGAPKHFGHDAVVAIEDGSPRRCYRLR